MTLKALLLSSSLVTGLLAQPVAFPAGNLTQWQLDGASRAQPSAGAVFSLPAGAQLSRTFAADSIAVVVPAPATPSAAPSTWPALELGNAILLFGRDGSVLRLYLGGDEGDPVALSLVVTPGTSVEFARNASGVSVTIGAERVALALPTATAGTEVIFSAGAQEDWPLEDVEFVLAGPAPLAAGQAATAVPRIDTAATSSRQTTLPAARAVTPAPTVVSSSSLGSSTTSSAPAAQPALKAAASSGFELFTPPSVRRGRADDVRTALEKTLR